MTRREEREREARLEMIKRIDAVKKVKAEIIKTLNAKVEEHELSPSELYWILASTMANLASADFNEEISDIDAG